MMNWRQIYGDDEFAVKAPIFWSDIVRRRQQKGVDMEELRQRAIDYAKVCKTLQSRPLLTLESSRVSARLTMWTMRRLQRESI